MCSSQSEPSLQLSATEVAAVDAPHGRHHELFNSLFFNWRCAQASADLCIHIDLFLSPRFGSENADFLHFVMLTAVKQTLRALRPPAWDEYARRRADDILRGLEKTLRSFEAPGGGQPAQADVFVSIHF